ncbi:hypothetical protein HMPREF9353_02386 [Treponema denticola F0402]|nr:hypothetical protein HMPREF9353_02386 [Treponema denticola F0402]
MIWKRTAGSYKHSHKKITKSFEKALDIKYRIRAVVRFYAFFILHRKARKALSFAQLRRGLLRMSLQRLP